VRVGKGGRSDPGHSEARGPVRSTEHAAAVADLEAAAAAADNAATTTNTSASIGIGGGSANARSAAAPETADAAETAAGKRAPYAAFDLTGLRRALGPRPTAGQVRVRLLPRARACRLQSARWCRSPLDGAAGQECGCGCVC
jgi:hypothetical protein